MSKGGTEHWFSVPGVKFHPLMYLLYVKMLSYRDTRVIEAKAPGLFF